MVHPPAEALLLVWESFLEGKSISERFRFSLNDENSFSGTGLRKRHVEEFNEVFFQGKTIKVGHRIMRKHLTNNCLLMP